MPSVELLWSCFAVVPQNLGDQTLSMDQGRWRLQKASGNSNWKMNQVVLLAKIVSAFISFQISDTDFVCSFLGPYPKSLSETCKESNSGRNIMVYFGFYYFATDQEKSFFAWIYDLWTCIKAIVCTSPMDYSSFSFKIHSHPWKLSECLQLNL